MALKRAESEATEGLRAVIHRRLLPRRHTVLLAAIVAAFVVRPLIGDTRIAPLLFSTALFLLLLVALYTIQVDDLIGERRVLIAQKRRRHIIGWALAVPAIVERIATSVIPSHSIVTAGSILWLLFIGYVTWCELRGVLKQKQVNGETIAMSISVYLLLGLWWGLLYITIFQLQPNSFSFGGSPMPVRASGSDIQQLFPVLIYFSLTTLSTIGFGDITPLTLHARYAAVAEGITGQFYLAILVARLVGLQMSQATRGEN